ncbi:hypothetical protein ACNVED_11120 [Legionella sp. D16C41]|uniref:hypothetical protein n=1 Tax=Legionella sp. D16C41 TaxID=3402688 RepID=UPI003AF86125
MPHVVIIGAGPSGLYLASKLRRKGIKDIVIYDPRAGDYVRPGFLNPGIFRQAEEGIKTKLPFNKKTSHIRDIEKTLHKHTLTQNVTIEKKEFVRFSEDKKGIFVASKDEQGNLTEEFVACDYVFDCTGGKRAVVDAINKRNIAKGKAKPFEVSAVSKDVVIQKHLIAYMKIDNSIATQADNITKPKMLGKTPLEFVRAIEDLRKFGWTEFTFPDCHSTFFKDNKNCLYIECPNNLLPIEKKAWLDTVLKVVTGKTGIQYEMMTPKNGRSKPNFSIFSLNPQQLNSFTYYQADIPHTIALGDAQIDPNFVLGHGVKGSFERIDTLVSGMVLINGKITYYDNEEYNSSVRSAIKDHQQAIIDYYKTHKLNFRKGVYEAKSIYEQAISATQDSQEKLVLKERLEEINARIAYYDALKILEEKIVNGKFQAKDDNLPSAAKLVAAKNAIIQSLSKLTQFEQEEAVEELKSLILAFKELGNRFFKQANFPLAIKYYKEALSLYSIQAIESASEKLTLYSNLILSYRKIGQLEAAFEKSEEALSLLEYANDTIKEKILFHFIKLTYESLLDPTNDSSDKLALLDTALKTHHVFIEDHLASQLKTELKLLNRVLHNYTNDLASGAEVVEAALGVSF